MRVLNGLRESSLLARTAQTFASLFGVMGISVFSAIILSRGLTPDDRGLYLGITMWNGFVLGLCDVGIYIATVYMWGKSQDGEKKDLFATLLTWSGGTGLVVAVLVTLITEWTVKGHLTDRESWAAYLFYASTFTGPITSMLSGVLAAQQRFTLINVIRVGLPLTLTVLWLFYYSFGTLSIYLCLLTATIVAFSATLPYLWQSRAYLRNLGRFRKDLFKASVWYSFKAYGGAVMNVLGGSGTQIFLFSLTPAALAFYQTAASATGVLWAIPRAVGMTSFPNMVQEERSLLHEKVCKMFRLTALSTVIGAVLLGLAEPMLIPVLFGNPYGAAIIPALILLPNALFGGLSDMLGNALNSVGRTLHNTVASAVLVGVTLGSMAFTIQAWGINGAAFSSVMGFLAGFIVRIIWYAKSIQRILIPDLIPKQADVRELYGLGLRFAGKPKKVRLDANRAN
ncbi:polysaccharide biosynthesis C-terminal domain-containing protein [Cohnella lubricantis]|uniref:Polysaccharide biosynthesis C-terminal domain-containing protein n=1 Tax=Cohnella lubricantis TaxID=2163172 RepID=A0A841TC77_9BACL|nr:polysaccharide biosynthesis C-terminal domain-containing protein [Cohnella lubricantis]MBB6676840.1 polysaccharide biosynthesis C-terminal domain-containing protein [Cohnella lubricantis]MBP2119420.1 O-antigen/teichoic acid export membrane protein [Cohnella lubricantis]